MNEIRFGGFLSSLVSIVKKGALGENMESVPGERRSLCGFLYFLEGTYRGDQEHTPSRKGHRRTSPDRTGVASEESFYLNSPAASSSSYHTASSKTRNLIEPGEREGVEDHRVPPP